MQGAEAGVIARLRDVDVEVRAEALGEVERVGVASFTQIDRLVDALRIAVRVGPAVATAKAIELLGRLGPRAAAAALDVCRALASTPDPGAAAETLVAFGALPAPARAILEAHASGPRAEVVAAAERVLTAVLFQSVCRGAGV